MRRRAWGAVVGTVLFVAAVRGCGSEPEVTPRVTPTVVAVRSVEMVVTPFEMISQTPLAAVTGTPVLVPTDTPVPAATDTLTPAPRDTPVPAATDTLTPAPRDTPVPVASDTPVPVPTDTPTTVPTDTPTPVPVVVGPVAISGANLRAGPGMEFEVMDVAAEGASVEVVGQNSAGNWLQTGEGLWIAASLVANAPAGLPVTAVRVVTVPTATAVAVVEAEPVAEVAATATVAPVVEPTATSSGWAKEVKGFVFQSDCPCDQGNVRNCDDFRDGYAAQACYLRCMDLVREDVHGLDRDNDEAACEWSW